MRILGKGVKMINFNSKKTKKTIASAIVILLVIAMVVPLILSFL